MKLTLPIKHVPKGWLFWRDGLENPNIPWAAEQNPAGQNSYLLSINQKLSVGGEFLVTVDENPADLAQLLHEIAADERETV